MRGETELSLAMISHELKNPLTLIRSTLQLIGNRYPAITKDSMWNQLSLDVEHLSRMISELSLVGTCDVDKYTDINVKKLFADLEKMYEGEIKRQKKSVLFRVNVSSNWVEGNELMLRRMMMNLIQNALEATEDGDYIEIISETKEEWMVFKVCDTGNGMTEFEVGEMFEPFVTHKVDGTGLGMVVVDRVVNAHHGKIQVKSEKNQGTEVQVFIPLKVKI